MVDISDDTHFLGKTKARLQKRTGTRESENRKPRERVVAPSDGRLLRSKNKAVKMNFRFSPEFKQRLIDLAEADEKTMTAILERGVELYEKQRKRAK